MAKRKLNAQFMLKDDGSLLIILHPSSDQERKKLAAMDFVVEHYGNEFWLTISSAWKRLSKP